MEIMEIDNNLILSFIKIDHFIGLFCKFSLTSKERNENEKKKKTELINEPLIGLSMQYLITATIRSMSIPSVHRS